MREGIHPEYLDATITCACGASFSTRSTAGSYTVDICKECHPFYTGKQRMVDTAGRVEKFRAKFAKAEKLKAEAAEREEAKAATTPTDAG
ncbi:MAG: 50S ribosomal protein L31 [Sandaracinaceae bacterium]|nr:50S ribosomal protein L31 [Sandaracinaceae bacterium]